MSIRTVNSESKKVALLNSPSLHLPLTPFLVLFFLCYCKKCMGKSDSKNALASFQSSQNVLFRWEDSPYKITFAMTTLGLWDHLSAERTAIFWRVSEVASSPLFWGSWRGFWAGMKNHLGLRADHKALRTMFSLHLVLLTRIAVL